MRLETGVIQEGDDWPGVFIRGDNAFHYARVLAALIQGTAGELEKRQAKSLLKLLQRSNVQAGEKPQMVKLEASL